MNLSKILKNKKPILMAILNTTPNSFSDGGKYNTTKKAIKHAKQLIAAGADIIDIGGESSGPGSKAVSAKEELARVLPVVKALKKISKTPISIDTHKAEVADAALKAGADMINDVTALRGDKNLAKIIARHKCPVVLMYSKDKTARTTIKKQNYQDVVKIVISFLNKQIKYAQRHGIARKNIILDPGMGHFVSALPKYSFEIIARLPEIVKLGQPVLVGISRKSFLGGRLNSRDEKGVIAEAFAYLNGACIIRTHDVSKFLNYKL